MNIENLDFNEIDNILDLDNFMNKVVMQYPQDENNFLFYIRGNIERGDCVLVSASTTFNLGFALFNLAIQNEVVASELLKAAEALNEYKPKLN